MENKEETVDIILPTYNGEKFIKEQIESILNQSHKNIRLLISDDCSTDGTIEILKKYKEKDNRIELYVQTKNLGVVKNIEFLLQKVTSNYYMLSDQDDYWLPEKVEKSLEKLKQNNADIVFGDLEVVDEKLKTIYPSFNDFMKLTRKIKNNQNSYKLNYLYNCITGCTILAKKQTIEKIIPIPTQSKYLIHDHWIGIITSLNGKIAYMPEKYIKYRQHGNNQIGTTKISHKFTQIEEVRELFINVKLGVFGTYVQNNERFPENLQKLNIQALEYFKKIKQKKKFNFRNWGIFHKLYKTETFMYYMENFIIMNMPLIGKFLFKIRLKILKLLKKR